MNSNTRGRIELGRIDLMQNYSFFEVPEKEATNVIKALNRAKWNGRKVVVEIAGAGEESGKGRGNGSNERKGNKRFGGKSDERAPRYENKDRKPKDASAKDSKSTKKINLVVLIGDTLMLAVRRRKMTGKSFLKIKNLTSAKKDGHVENLRRNKYEASIIRRFVHY